MVQDQSPGELTVPARRPRWLIVLTIVLLVTGSAYLVGERYTSHLFALAPGSAPPVQGYITIKAPGQVHPHKGQILLVTVALRTVNPLDYLADKLNHDVQIVDQKALVGPAKPAHVLTPSVTARGIVNMTAIAAAEAAVADQAPATRKI